MLKDYILTAALIVTYVFLAMEGVRRLHSKRPARRSRYEVLAGREAGLVFGSLGVLLQVFDTEFRSFGVIDLHYLAVMIAVAMFGAQAAVLAAGLSAGAWLVGHGVHTELLVSVGFLLLTAAIAGAVRKLRGSHHLVFLMANMGVLLVLFIWLYVKTHVLHVRSTMGETAVFPHLLLVFLTGTASCYAVFYIVSAHRMARLHQETNVKMSALLTHFQAGILYEDENGYVSLINDAFYRLFPGAAAPRYIGCRTEKVLEELSGVFIDGAGFLQHWREHTQGQEEALQQEWRLQDGRTLESSYIPVLSEHGAYMGHMWKLRDVTGRKEMEERAETNKQMYKSLFEYNRSACFMINPEGRITEVNQAVEHITGYPRHMLLGSAFAPLIYRDDLPRTQQHFYETLQGKSHTFDTRLIHVTGRNVDLIVNCSPVIVQGEIIGIIGLAHDVTEQKRVAQEHLESVARYQKLVELSPEAVFVHSQERIEFVNERVIELLGVASVQEVIGKTFLDFLHPEDQRQAALNMAYMFSRGEPLRAVQEYRLVRADGTFVMTEIRSAYIEYNGQQAVLGIVHDVTKSKEAEQRLKQANYMLRQLSQRDGLTGIANRRFYDERLAQEWERAAVTSAPLAIVLLDIDEFKAYNDAYGHQQGDFCLKLVAGAVETAAAERGGFAARYGGEEFAVILPHCDQTAALGAAAGICQAIADLQLPHCASAVAAQVTVSAGAAACMPAAGTTAEKLLAEADAALYRAKRSGRNRAAGCGTSISLL